MLYYIIGAIIIIVVVLIVTFALKKETPVEASNLKNETIAPPQVNPVIFQDTTFVPTPGIMQPTLSPQAKCNNIDKSYWYAAGNPPYCDTNKNVDGSVKVDPARVKCNDVDKSYWYAAGNPPYCDLNKNVDGSLKVDAARVKCNDIDKSYWYAAGNPPYCDYSKNPNGSLK